MFADTWEIEGLKTLALRKFVNNLKAPTNGTELVRCIQEVYKDDNESYTMLRPIVVEAAHRHLSYKQLGSDFLQMLVKNSCFRDDRVAY